MKHYTDILQSRKLLELGLDSKTADMSWVNDLEGDHIIAKPYKELHDELEQLRTNLGELESNESPAWSLAALLELMPFMISLIDNYYSLWFGKNETEYFIGYGNVNNGNNICKFEGEDFVSVVVDAVCWLLENKCIKTE